jgi:hypothetical protein
MTIEKDSFLGVIERIEENDTVGELNVKEMTVNIEQMALPTPTTEEKKKYILDNAKLNVPEEFRQRYIDLLLKHHEVVSSSKYNLGKCTTLMHDIELKTEDPIYIKQFRILEGKCDAVQKHIEELLKLGVVKPLRSKFNIPIFVVNKKDGGMHIIQESFGL